MRRYEGGVTQDEETRRRRVSCHFYQHVAFYAFYYGIVAYVFSVCMSLGQWRQMFVDARSQALAMMDARSQIFAVMDAGAKSLFLMDARSQRLACDRDSEPSPCCDRNLEPRLCLWWIPGAKSLLLVDARDLVLAFDGYPGQVLDLDAPIVVFQNTFLIWC